MHPTMVHAQMERSPVWVAAVQSIEKHFDLTVLVVGSIKILIPPLNEPMTIIDQFLSTKLEYSERDRR